jgi:hypothetical protein
MVDRRTSLVVVPAVLLTLLLLSPPSHSREQVPQAGVEIQLSGDAGSRVIKVTGWTGTDRVQGVPQERLTDLFAVFLEGVATDLPPILGSYRIDGDELLFVPRFPLSPGMSYRAVFRPTAVGADGEERSATFSIPEARTTPTTIVEKVYPTADVLPENQLKFYLHFSASMSRGEAYERIHLLDAAGETIELPFLELDQELWTRDFKRFTILFDPGRIKTGLIPNLEMGLPIVSGNSYTLLIDREWQDATGTPLKEEYRKTFTVSAFDKVAPDMEAWGIRPAGAGTRDVLTVEFPESLDRALLDRLITIVGPRGDTITGVVDVDRNETRWLFTPDNTWQAGEHRLVAGTELEDLAGNTLAGLFEVDVFEVGDATRKETESRSFTIPPR